MTPLRIALVGAGYIGRKHAEAIAACPGAALTAVVEPSPVGDMGVPHYTRLEDLPEGAADAVLLATPTGLHAEQVRHCIARGLPVLVEKPATGSAEETAELAAEAEAAGVPVLVGHHRRHDPIVAVAHDTLASGRIGRVITAQVSILLCKPKDYFDPAWRRKKGAGPILTNLVHEIDLMRHFLGEVAAVQAMASNAIRGHEVEDTAVVLLRLTTGVMVTVTISDAAAAPWSWERTAGDNPDYPPTGQSSALYSGTEGSLEVPTLRLWTPEGEASWYTPLQAQILPCAKADPLPRQIAHFTAVARGETPPVVSLADAARTQAVLNAVQQAITTRKEVAPS